MPLLRALSCLLPLLLAGCVDSSPFFSFVTPGVGLLAASGEGVDFSLVLPPFVRPETLRVRVVPVAGGAGDTASALTVSNRRASGRTAALAPGRHLLEAEVEIRVGALAGTTLRTGTWVEAASLPHPDVCENLNAVECLLPFPSSRFLVPASTKTGVRVALPQEGMPTFLRPIPAAAYSGQDGFSPMVQILAHFPGGVDPELSEASRLLPETRSYGTRSLEDDSPTLLFDATEGMARVLHFVERDVNAPGSIAPAREVLFLRPGASLAPGHRYVVAMRNLRHPDGSAVAAEPVFAALRDRRPTSLPGVEAQRPKLEELFAKLGAAGVKRGELVLAFDFVVQSDEDLTGAALAMRDRAFAWLDAQSEPTFTVAPFVDEPAEGQLASREFDCSDPAVLTWRRVRGTFRVPLFLSSDPIAFSKVGGRLLDPDGDGLPDAAGTMEAPFTITIPCAARGDGAGPLLPLLVGHGLFVNGELMVGVSEGLDGVLRRSGTGAFSRVAGATDWLGLSSNDLDFRSVGASFIVQSVLFDLGNFGTLPDRLRQGMTNTLVLGRMLKRGVFNGHAAFRTPGGAGVLAGAGAPLDYFGVSLGGIMGLELAALSPDVRRASVDVPGSNFSMLMQRSRAIGLIGTFLYFMNPDPLSQVLLFGLLEELWDSGEPAGYLTHVTEDPLPGSGAPKPVLFTVARFDGIVANESSEITARTLGLPNLHVAAPPSGSAVSQLPLVADVPGPLGARIAGNRGAQVWYDLGMYRDLDAADFTKYAPPLANTNVSSNCDPHGQTFLTLASARQIATFLDAGEIANFCDGLCDGLDAVTGEPALDEIQGDRTEPCDPRTEPAPELPF